MARAVSRRSMLGSVAAAAGAPSIGSTALDTIPRASGGNIAAGRERSHDGTLTVTIGTLPSESNGNEYAPGARFDPTGLGWMTELVLPSRIGQSAYQPSGHAWTVDDAGTGEVLAWIADYDVEAPFEWTETYDERATYPDRSLPRATVQFAGLKRYRSRFPPLS